jgi:uncharacterized coiled-coil protein SlyX
VTIEELDLAIQDTLTRLNTENDLLGGLFGQIADQQLTVDRLANKLHRLQSAQAELKGIVEPEAP